MATTHDIERADPAYRHDLGNGLVLRWSTAADTDQVAERVGQVFRSKADDPPNVRMIERTERQMRGDHPLMGPGDYAVVEDTRREGNRIVACSCLWRHTWAYEGIPFGVGRPEYVATDPDYRQRGLVRAIFSLLHARSAAEGHRLQAITGIPHFYRQFGYEYALDLEGKRVTYLSLIPALKEGETEAYGLRDATVADIPLIAELYARRAANGVVSTVVPEEDWRYDIAEWPDFNAPGKQKAFKMIVDQTGVARGYLVVSAKRRESGITVYALEMTTGANLRAALPPLLRELARYGKELPAINKTAPFREISFMLGREHPVYEALGQSLAPFYEPPYAWYIRVPDVPGFLRLVAPALEKRLASSVMAGFTGDLKMDCYRGGWRLAFEQGRLATVEPWQAPAFGDEAGAGCPTLVFLQLLFGYRSLTELRHAFPDVWANEEPALLLDALFPKRTSWVID